MIFKALTSRSKKLYSSPIHVISFNKQTTESILNDQPTMCIICKRVCHELLNQNRTSELSQFKEFIQTYNVSDWKITVW